MGILRADRVSGLGGANAIVGSTRFAGSGGNGSSKTVTYFKDSSLSPGTSDFCAEAWVYFNFVDNTHNTQLFANLGGNFGFANDTSWAVIRLGANNQFYGWSGSAWVAFGAGAPTVNTWHYIQLVRASNVQTLYMDGTALASTVTNSNDLTNDEITLGGRDDGSEVLDGYISNFRLTIGSSASALAGIVPSAASRVLSTDTKLLCCNDPGNVNNEDAQGIPTSTTPDNDVQMIQGFASRFVPDKGEDHGTTFADNTKFDTLSYMVPPGGTTAQSNRGRGVFGGGYTSVPGDAAVKRIYYIQIDSMGTSAEFGDTNKAAAWGQGGCSSSTRGLFTGGTTPTNLNTIDYITIATTSNALDFGDLNVQHGYTASCSNNTRGLTGGGRGGSPTARTAQIDYNTIATLGNGQDFGDLTQSRMGLGAFASSTRGVFTGGNGSPADPSTVYNIIDYVEFATTGNATDFGDMTDEHTYHGSCSSSTRGIMYGGVTSYGPAVNTSIIEYVTIASTGNGTDFGDVRDDGAHAHGTSNSIRGVFAGGVDPYRNSIDFVTITTTGNGVDWGDLPIASGSYAYAAGLSDSHGGIS